MALRSDRDQSDWWGASFEIGRAPFDSKFCAVWHALFESFAPIERGLAPAYRCLVRSRAAALLGSSVVDREDVRPMGLETASPIWNLGVSPAEWGDLLRSYVHGVPQSAVLVIDALSELVGPVGSLAPLGVIAGMAFALVTRAYYAARLQ